MPLQQTSGNDTQDAYGGGTAAGPAVYVENVFSTYLYTGTHANKTISQNQPLYQNNWLIWIKDRTNTSNHVLTDNLSLGPSFYNSSNLATAYTTDYGSITSVSYSPPTSSFSLGTSNVTNASGDNFVSYSFATKQKFFDIQTYSGTNAVQNISHNLGSVPGCIIIKRLDSSGQWCVYHNGLNGGTNPQNYGILLNSANAQTGSFWNNTAPTSTQFTVGTNGSVNTSGGSYVAYLFASNAGGFGLKGTDNVITCGSFTVNSSGNFSVNLGYEPQWILAKDITNSANWAIYDNMRGWSQTNENALHPNLTNAEYDDLVPQGFFPNATGFACTAGAVEFTPNANVIYIAIRRGPMAVPTDPTTVFAPTTRTGNNATTAITGIGFPPDASIIKTRSVLTDSAAGAVFTDKLRGPSAQLISSGQDAEFITSINTAGINSFDQNGITLAPAGGTGDKLGYENQNTVPFVNYYFKRAPSFFDEVCYTGNGNTDVPINHNLKVAPQLLIIKDRSSTSDWYSNVPSLGAGCFYLNKTDAFSNGLPLISSVSNSTFNLAGSFGNNSGDNYVAYLFATCSGVSKVGTYTGNGTTQTINCGFAAGARFVLIKRTDSTGNWYVYDTARGMTTLTDPYLLLNSTAAESATLGSVTSVTTGFAVNAAVLAAINTSGATYLYLSIA